METNRLFIGLSVFTKVLVLLTVLVTAVGGQKLILAKLIQPGYDHWASQFELLAIGNVDIVFLGDSIIDGENSFLGVKCAIVAFPVMWLLVCLKIFFTDRY